MTNNKLNNRLFLSTVSNAYCDDFGPDLFDYNNRIKTLTEPTLIMAGCNISKRVLENWSHKPIDNIISDHIILYFSS
jgi:hypothetical protein